nr:hypothetical protein [uncultured Campylobacter sp.]
MSANFTMLHILSATARAFEYKFYIVCHIYFLQTESALRILKFYGSRGSRG